jgi:LEA14-like dessication related protein
MVRFMNGTRRSILLMMGIIALLTTGCFRPDPPTIKPDKATVSSISSESLVIRIRMKAYNPNSYDLTGKSLTGQIVINKNIDLGEVTVPTKTTLPSKKWVSIEANLKAKMGGVGQVAALAAMNSEVPYVVSGNVVLDGKFSDISVPYKTSGKISQAELIKMGVKGGLPSIPGLTIP